MSTVHGKSIGSLLAELTAPVPDAALAFRQDGKPKLIPAREGRPACYKARWVTYVEAGFVRTRLDAVVPGRWSLRIEPIGAGTDHNKQAVVVVKASIGIHLDDGTLLVREDVGEGGSYKAASTDAFKRAAARWGIAHELYDHPQLWVLMDGDGQYARKLEDPADVLARALARQERDQAERAQRLAQHAPQRAPRETAQNAPRADAHAPAKPERATAQPRQARPASARPASAFDAAAHALREIMADPVFDDTERESVEKWIAGDGRTVPDARALSEYTAKAATVRDERRAAASAAA